MSCSCVNNDLSENLCSNLELFNKRFPELSDILNFKCKNTSEILNKVPLDYQLIPCNTVINKTEEENIKASVLYTLKVKNKFLHSKYNPLHEAEKTFSSLNCVTEDSSENSFCFYGLGLGYLQEIFIKHNQKTQVILIEPDIFIFILFLASRKLDSFFKHEKLIILPGIPPSETISVLEKICVKYNSFKFKPSLEVSSLWFSELQTLEKRRKEKDKLNLNTLKKFGNLWMRNFIKNIEYTSTLKSIGVFKNIFSGYPALVIAAGPGLDKQLKILKKHHERFVVISVDTALNICLKNGITPDFAVLMDAQYWNYLHVAGIQAPGTVLITEACVNPAVFRLKFKEKCLCSSFFPFGRYIENEIEKKDILSAGGSVATTAWDFASYINAETIIMAGLDLAFTDKKTHFSGCRFENESIINTSKISTAEQASHKVMFSAMPENAKGYTNQVITDARLKMYAWWFESKLAEKTGQKTFNLMSAGLEIPNMPNIDYAFFSKIYYSSKCGKKIKKEKIEKALKSKIIPCTTRNIKRFEEVLSSVSIELNAVLKTAEEAEKICTELLSEKTIVINHLDKLSALDKKLSASKINTAIGFELLLNSKEDKSEKKASPEPSIKASIEVYKAIIQFCKKYLLSINKYYNTTNLNT